MMRTALWVFLLIAVGFGVWWLRHLPESPPPESERRVAVEPSVQRRTDEAAWQALAQRLSGRLARSAQQNSAEPTAPEPEPGPYRSEAELMEALGIAPEDEARLTAEYEQWARERGYEVESVGYEFYDRATLEALANSGDMYAMQRLGDLAQMQDEDYHRAAVQFQEAAVQGSVQALDSLALNATIRAIHAGNENKPESTRSLLLEAMAWNQLAERRGHGALVPGVRERSIRHHLEQFDVELTEADREAVDAMTEHAYANLEERRERMNLGRFDNRLPTLLEKLQQLRDAQDGSEGEP